MQKPPYKAHERALIDPGAIIGKDTRVWAFAHILSGAKIGAYCNIGDYAFIEGGAILGDHVTVKNGVQVWEGVTAEDKVFLGPNCVFTNDMFPRSGQERAKETWFKKTLLKEGCSIGANATVLCGITVGRYAYIAAGSVVTKDVPDFALMLGVPARFHSWICRCGTKLTVGKTKKARCVNCDTDYALKKNGRKELLTLK